MKTGGAVSSFDPRIQEEKKEVEREDKNPHDVKCTPFFYAKPAVEKPLATCLFFCGGLLIFFMVSLQQTPKLNVLNLSWPSESPQTK